MTLLTLNTAAVPVANDSAAPAPADKPVAASAPSRWEASIHLQLAQRARGTRLIKNQHIGPLYVQKPFYPEGDQVAHVYLLHPPGGLVSGDSLRISADLQGQSRAVFTTPGAGRVYRARKDLTLQKQSIHFTLAAGAQLEWLPMETIIFPGANTQLTTRVDVQPGSLFCGWDITCLGLQANQQAFNQGSARQRFAIYEQGRLALLESFAVTGGDQLFLHGSAALRSCSVNGFFVIGPIASNTVAPQALEKLIDGLRMTQSDYLFGVTQVKNYLVLRYLGNDSAEARKVFLAAWQRLRPVIFQRLACEPRIWAT